MLKSEPKVTPVLTTVTGADELRGLIGQTLGPSSFRCINQTTIDRFALATGDNQWIHTKPELAAAGPFGATIAHGYLTSSLGPAFLPQLLEVKGFSAALNYGSDKVRYLTPVPVDSYVNLKAVEVLEVTDVERGVQVKLRLTFAIFGVDKPACVAEVIYRYLV